MLLKFLNKLAAQCKPFLSNKAFELDTVNALPATQVDIDWSRPALKHLNIMQSVVYLHLKKRKIRVGQRFHHQRDVFADLNITCSHANHVLVFAYESTQTSLRLSNKFH